MDENICYSGGADGADIAWGEVAKLHGHKVVHFMFGKHKNLPKLKGMVRILSEAELKKADNILKKVNDEVLHRSFPAHSDYVSNLLRRDYYQVIKTDSVYAVTELEENTVKGGTAWAVETFKMLFPDNDKLYVFDQNQNKWFQRNLDIFDQWREIDKPPVPSGAWTGIGTRNLNPSGQNQIERIFDA